MARLIVRSIDMKKYGNSGIGMSKHGKGGYSPRSPKYKINQTREANDEIEKSNIRKRNLKPKMFNTVKDLFK